MNSEHNAQGRPQVTETARRRHHITMGWCAGDNGQWPSLKMQYPRSVLVKGLEREGAIEVF